MALAQLFFMVPAHFMIATYLLILQFTTKTDLAFDIDLETL
jgi:hypothetical protein